jgi:hypothetical protein
MSVPDIRAPRTMDAFSYPHKFSKASKRKAPKASKGTAPPLSLAQMTRRLCAQCGDPEALMAGTRCCSCGNDLAVKTKIRRPRVNGNPSAPLRSPIADGDNVLALMGAKA